MVEYKVPAIEGLPYRVERFACFVRIARFAQKWRRGLINNWNNIRKNRIDIRFLKLVFPIVVGVIGNVVLQAPVEENVITVSETKI